MVACLLGQTACAAAPKAVTSTLSGSGGAAKRQGDIVSLTFVAEIEGAEHDLRTDVVRKVADHCEGVAIGDACPVLRLPPQHVALVDGYSVGLCPFLFCQMGDALRINLHHFDAAPAELDHGQRERTGARADFQHGMIWNRRNGFGNAHRDAGVAQEMLSEVFFRLDGSGVFAHASKFAHRGAPFVEDLEDCAEDASVLAKPFLIIFTQPGSEGGFIPFEVPHARRRVLHGKGGFIVSGSRNLANSKVNEAPRFHDLGDVGGAHIIKPFKGLLRLNCDCEVIKYHL